MDVARLGGAVAGWMVAHGRRGSVAVPAVL